MGWIIQARKTNPNLNFRARIFSGGVGVFHMKGWGPKSSVCPSKPGKSNFFGGDIPGFWWDIPGAPDKFEKKKVWVQFSFPKYKRSPASNQQNKAFNCKLRALKSESQGLKVGDSVLKGPSSCEFSTGSKFAIAVPKQYGDCSKT